MGYTKDGSDAWTEEERPCGQHSFSHWGLMRLNMIRDTERDGSKQPITRRICSPHLSSLPSHQTHIDKLESLKMEYYITTRLATRWWKRLEIMGEIHKGRKRCTAEEK